MATVTQYTTATLAKIKPPFHTHTHMLQLVGVLRCPEKETKRLPYIELASNPLFASSDFVCAGKAQIWISLFLTTLL
jgi:hypothetical protein